MLPMERADRCIKGRGEANRALYVSSLKRMGRRNIGYDETGNQTALEGNSLDD
tara:strand:- start:4091 stop:4249 length:159 start_codon:yes stop_codon:yes gene_type:complete